jgi:hypothetical protein
MHAVSVHLGLGELKDGPEESDEFARNRGHHERFGFQARAQATIAPTQPLLGFVGDLEHRGRLARASPPERRTEAGLMLIVPRGLDEQPPDQPIAHLGDCAGPTAIARGVFTGDEANESHERARMREAPEVV